MAKKKKVEFESKLKDYLKKKGMSYREFQRLTGIDYTLLCRIYNGKRKVTSNNARIIVRATGGAVGYEDLLEQ